MSIAPQYRTISCIFQLKQILMGGVAFEILVVERGKPCGEERFCLTLGKDISFLCSEVCINSTKHLHVQSIF